MPAQFPARSLVGAISLALLAAVAPSAVTPSAASYPGFNGRIALSFASGDFFELYTVQPSGQDIRLLIPGSGAD